jgi:hypothetical protein
MQVVLLRRLRAAVVTLFKSCPVGGSLSYLIASNVALTTFLEPLLHARCVGLQRFLKLVCSCLAICDRQLIEFFD